MKNTWAMAVCAVLIVVFVLHSCNCLSDSSNGLTTGHSSHREYILLGDTFSFDLDTSFYDSSKVVQGIVRSERVAASIADLIFVSSSGDEARATRPYVVELGQDSIWTVHGTLQKRWLGGVSTIRIRAKDGCVVEYYQTR